MKKLLSRLRLTPQSQNKSCGLSAAHSQSAKAVTATGCRKYRDSDFVHEARAAPDGRVSLPELIDRERPF